MTPRAGASASLLGGLRATSSIGTAGCGRNQMVDMSLLGFIGHLAHFEHRLHEAEHKGFEHVAKIVEAEAKKEIGNYQEAAGPFAAWAELADATKEDRVKQGFTENDPGRRSGEMADGIKHASDHEGATIGSDDDKMVWFTLGTSKQPPRDVFGIATIHKEHEITAVLGGSVVTALIGRDVFHGAIPIKGE